MKKTLADTKREILRNFDDEFQGMYSAEKKSVEDFLSTALDQAWRTATLQAYQSFLEVIKDSKNKFPNSKEFELVVNVRDIENAIDELNQRIKDYES